MTVLGSDVLERSRTAPASPTMARSAWKRSPHDRRRSQPTEHPALDLAGASVADLKRLVHSATQSQNAPLEKRGAVVGMRTPAGFRDVLPSGVTAVCVPSPVGSGPPSSARLDVGRRRIALMRAVGVSKLAELVGAGWWRSRP